MDFQDFVPQSLDNECRGPLFQDLGLGHCAVFVCHGHLILQCLSFPGI